MSLELMCDGALRRSNKASLVAATIRLRSTSEKGATEAIAEFVRKAGGTVPESLVYDI